MAQRWLVSLALPIEAETAAEAVGEFWGYVRAIGPAQLPTFVWPRGEELAMRAYLLADSGGAPTDLDPEQD